MHLASLVTTFCQINVFVKLRLVVNVCIKWSQKKFTSISALVVEQKIIRVGRIFFTSF